MASMQPITLGQLLQRYRRAARLTQEALAARAGLGVHTVADLERGVSHYPHPHTVQALADALRLTDSSRAAFAAAGRRHGSSLFEEAPTGGASPHRSLFVGRAHERALYERFVSGEGPPLLLFSGEPGIGKSRLLTETAAHARDAGWRVLTGGCVRSSGQAPYEPFVTLLARALAATPPTRQRHDLHGCAWLARLLPELGETTVVPAPAWVLPPDQERRLVFGAVARYLSNVAGPAGVMLLLDDLQWAGADAVDLLVGLIRGFMGAADTTSLQQVRVVGAYRSTEVSESHPLALYLPDLARDGLAQREHIGPLAPDEACLLLGELLKDQARGERAHGAETTQMQQALVDAVAGRAGGVPYFLVTCAQEVHAGLHTDPDGSQRPSTLPWDIVQSILARASALGVATLEVLRAAAVIGRLVPHALLAAVMTQSGQSEHDLIAALERADHARLLVAAEGETAASPVDTHVGSGADSGADVRHAGRYQFAHDLAREAILSGMVPAKRLVLHRAVAETIERLPEGERLRWMAQLADHFLRADEPARALPYTLLAGDQAMAVYAHAEAERHYHAASKLARAVGDQRREAAALERLTRVTSILGHFDDALRASAQGMAVYTALGDVEGEARMVWLLGWAHVRQGTPGEGLTQILALGEELRGRELSLRAEIWLQLLVFVLCEHIGAAKSRGKVGRQTVVRTEQIVAVARSAQDLMLLTEALTVLAKMALTLDEERALLALEEVVALDAPTGEVWNQAEVLTLPVFATKTLAYLYLKRGLFERGGPLYGRALGEAIRVGNVHDIRSVYTARGLHAFYQGSWKQARLDFERAADVIRKVEGSTDEAMLLLFVINVAEGRAKDASADILDCLARCATAHNHFPQCAAQSMLAERELVDDRYAAARDRLQTLVDAYGAELDEDDLLPVLTRLAWAYLDRGEVARAEEVVAETKARAGASSYALLVVDALRVEAQVRIAQARWLEAEAELEEALAHVRAMPYPYAEAKTLWVYGRLEAARGEPAAARTRFEQALLICDRLGEGLYRTHIDRDLRRLAQQA